MRGMRRDCATRGYPGSQVAECDCLLQELRQNSLQILITSTTEAVVDGGSVTQPQSATGKLLVG